MVDLQFPDTILQPPTQSEIALHHSIQTDGDDSLGTLVSLTLKPLVIGTAAVFGQVLLDAFRANLRNTLIVTYKGRFGNCFC